MPEIIPQLIFVVVRNPLVFGPLLLESLIEHIVFILD